ncbi:MFS general substrate transporter [Peniophora sp. CONT]|nr:MFS general substrate transporter [Peniophora sp. CONT]
MSDEQTPLLAERADVDAETLRAEVDHEAVYKRFTEKKKLFILLMVSWGGLLPMFVSGSFLPSIPQIAREFGTTGAVINIAVSLSLFGSCIGSLTWARYSSFYGRRPVYLASFPLLIIGSLGVARSRGVNELYFWRIVQAFGSGGGFSVGGGVIADIYKLEERGKAMGIFFAACLLGPAIAPPTGGFVAYYWSWRAMQMSMFVTAILAFAVIYMCLPETSQPNARGIDKLNEGLPIEEQRWRFTFLNPFANLVLLRSPVVLSTCLIATSILMTDFLILNPLSYTIGEAYGIRNEALIGLFFVPAGVGNLIGAPLAGRISDTIVVKWRKRRAGVWVPEDRLRAALLGAGVLVPFSILFFGLITTFVPGHLGIALTLVVLFMNGIGVDFGLTPMQAYSVDILHHQSAEVMAATASLRGMIIALAVSGILPTIERFGTLATYSAAALVSWAFFGLLLVTIRYGDRMRAWIDCGYSTPANN